MNRTVFAFASAAALLMGVAVAQAGPMSPAPAKDASATETLAELAHGCHRSVEWGPAGYHYHVGPGCARVSAGPRREYRERRGPVCYQECKYIGPIKTCKTRCR